ncbi:putative zinc-finger multi-pass transmembrane protein [Trypanosoma theileri]|uniref:Palmitoyltransferase n=1 Tax=Trypanosoma theileri TaxID=67003 RepID=A0A1X0NW18_9TRYP|nr:putative zinc-finger multi-pass transmembrane protein [Trypanosoma theileri]ORC88877.1 putative zinc-finger multi-pass transmembrane protein [Trypanosoma theileri]
MEVLSEVIFSWGTVYLAIAMPAFAMILNFVIGSCFLSEVLAHSQFADTTKKNRRGNERLFMVLIIFSFIWQYYTYMFQSRLKDMDCCNLPVCVWRWFDRLIWRKEDFSWNLLFKCSLDEMFYLSLWLTHAVLYFCCALSNPHVKEKTSRSSFCRRCDAHVDGMDHHCMLIGNCIGSSNRRIFLCLLGISFLNMLFLLFMRGNWAYREGNIPTLVGLLVVVFVAIVSFSLLIFQLCLIWKGKTTRSFWKEYYQSRKSVVRALFDLVK